MANGGDDCDGTKHHDAPLAPTSWKKAQVVKRYGNVLRDSCILCIYDLSDSIIKYY